MTGETAGLSPPLAITRCRLWKLPTIVDARGQLVVAELAAMPFPVKRVFFVSRVPINESRGCKAHKFGTELLIAISGNVAVAIEDGARRTEVILRDPGLGLVVGPMIWSVLSRFSEDAVLAVFASHPYDAADDIHDYALFRSMVAGH